MYDDCIVIPAGMRLEILDLLHQGHLGITKTQARGKMSVWWPAITTSITDMVTKCFTCAKNRPVPKEPLMSSSFPSRPWERLAADFFDLKGKKHLIVVDYYSRWTEVKALPSELSESVIKALKVWIRDQDRMERVLAASSSPRSYIEETDKGTQLPRNRAALVSADTCTKTPDTQPEANVETEMLRQKSKVPASKDLTTAATKPTESCYKAEPDTPKVQITRSGRGVKPPQRFIQDT